MGVAGVEAFEQVRGLAGIQHHHLGGGVCAGAHPHPAGDLLLLLLPFLLLLRDMREGRSKGSGLKKATQIRSASLSILRCTAEGLRVVTVMTF